jgi:hypothetical protein
MMPPTPTSTLVFAAAMGMLWLSVAPLVSGLVAEMFGTRYMATLLGIAFRDAPGRLLSRRLGRRADLRRAPFLRPRLADGCLDRLRRRHQSDPRGRAASPAPRGGRPTAGDDLDAAVINSAARSAEDLVPSSKSSGTARLPPARFSLGGTYGTGTHHSARMAWRDRRGLAPGAPSRRPNSAMNAKGSGSSWLRCPAVGSAGRSWGCTCVACRCDTSSARRSASKRPISAPTTLSRLSPTVNPAAANAPIVATKLVRSTRPRKTRRLSHPMLR